MNEEVRLVAVDVNQRPAQPGQLPGRSPHIRPVSHNAGRGAFGIATRSDHADPIAKVTILPAAMALGVTEQLPVDERHPYSKSYVRASLAVRLGGRAAELVVFGEGSTGASNDLAGATQLATRMVREFGLSPELGPVGYSGDGSMFLDGEQIRSRPDAEATQRVIDSGVSHPVVNADDVPGSERLVPIERLAAVLAPVVGRLTACRTPPTLAALAVLLATLGLAGAAIALLVPPVTAQLGTPELLPRVRCAEIEALLANGPLGLPPVPLDRVVADLQARDISSGSLLTGVFGVAHAAGVARTVAHLWCERPRAIRQTVTP